MDTNGKAPCYGRSSQVTSAETAYNGNGQRQDQSRNGSSGQYGRYGKGEFFIGPKQALQDLQDKRIGLVAFAILCDVRSKGINWQLRIREVRKRFGWGERAARTAMRQLTNAGWAQLEYERGKGGAIQGSHYVISKMPFTETAVTQASVNSSLIKDGSEERNKAGVNESLGSKADLKSKVREPAHKAFSLSDLPEDQAEIVRRFNKTFVPKSAQPINKATPDVRRILRHCGWGYYTAFEKAALADHANWRKRPGFVALWHAYKPFGKGKRSAKPAWLAGDIDTLKARVTRWRDRRDDLYHEDRKGSERQRAELQKKIDAIDDELERRNVNVEAMRTQRAARRSEREHEAIKHEPIIPWLNGNGETELARAY